MRRIVGLLALSLVGMFAALLVVELCLRFFFPQDPLFYDYGRIMRLTPDGRPELVPGVQTVLYGAPVRINSLGFRGQDSPREKGGRVFRIAVLGDSVTFGVGVDDASVFTQKIEDLLRPRYGASIEVRNLGVVGYDLEQELSLLRAKGLGLKPDLVILGVTLNDLEAADVGDEVLFNLRVSRNGGYSNVLKAGIRLVGLTNEFLRTRFHVYNLVKTRFVGVAFRYGLLTPNLQVLELPPERLNAAIERFGSGLHELKSLGERHGFALLVVIFPYEMQLSHAALERHREFYQADLTDRVLEASPQRELRRLCEALAIPVLDLLGPFRASELEGLFLKQPTVPDFVHLSPRGHAVAAEAIVRVLLSKLLLPPVHSDGSPDESSNG